MDSNYKNKYLKYKNKYLKLKNQTGGHNRGYFAIFYNSQDLEMTSSPDNVDLNIFINSLKKKTCNSEDLKNIIGCNYNKSFDIDSIPIKIPSFNNILKALPNSHYIDYKSNKIKSTLYSSRQNQIILKILKYIMHHLPECIKKNINKILEKINRNMTADSLPDYINKNYKDIVNSNEYTYNCNNVSNICYNIKYNTFRTSSKVFEENEQKIIIENSNDILDFLNKQNCYYNSVLFFEINATKNRLIYTFTNETLKFDNKPDSLPLIIPQNSIFPHTNKISIKDKDGEIVNIDTQGLKNTVSDAVPEHDKSGGSQYHPMYLAGKVTVEIIIPTIALIVAELLAIIYWIIRNVLRFIILRLTAGSSKLINYISELDKDDDCYLKPIDIGKIAIINKNKGDIFYSNIPAKLPIDDVQVLDKNKHIDDVTALDKNKSSDNVTALDKNKPSDDVSNKKSWLNRLRGK